MKNITNVPYSGNCAACGLSGYFFDTPNGADYTSCPCCDHWIGYDNELEKSEYYREDIENDCDYCYKCGIIFSCCWHNMGGCTDNTYNAHFIKKWKDKTKNITYEEGMPQFESVKDYFENIDNIEILEWHCPHKGKICSRTTYPIDPNKNCSVSKQ